MSNPLATYAAVVANLVDTGSGATDYVQESLPNGSTDQPAVTLAGSGSPSIYTDSSGWVNYALDTVAPIHDAVIAAERNDAIFNPGSVASYGGNVTINEAAQPWARSDVLSYFFGSLASGSNGFTTVSDLTTIQAGDILAYATGIYADSSNPNAASDPTLPATAETGHSMIVTGTPVAVPQDDWTGDGFNASSSVAVYAVAVIDASDVRHYADTADLTEPQADTRSYAAVPAHPPGLPAGLAASDLSPGGVGAGTLWFAVDSGGNVTQVRFNASGSWFPDATAPVAFSVGAARLTGGIDLSGAMLDANNNLIVNAYANAAPVLGGTAYNTQSEVLTGAGGLWVQGGGSVKLGAGNSFTGGTNLDGATVELAGADAAGSGVITYVDGVVSRLLIDNAAALPAVSVANIGVGDQIDFAYLGFGTGSATLSGGTLHVASGASSTMLALGAAAPVTSFTTQSDGAGGTLVTAACYAEGTRILTARGEVAIELLVVGDLVPTLRAARLAPIRWIGRRRLNAACHPRPWDVNPVRVKAGAFGVSLPIRDLVLSPDHAVFVDGQLVPIRHLANEVTVVQEAAGWITYWHVELDEHDVIFADGMPAETYLDTGNRDSFENVATSALHPVFGLRDRAAWDAAACAPLLESGPGLDAIRAMLARRAADMGTPVPVGIEVAIGAAGRVRADLPAGATRVHLTSRCCIPDGERRRLGAAIIAVTLDGASVALASPDLAAGFHEVESDGARSWRWTNGFGVLRLAASARDRTLDIEVTLLAA